MGIWNMWKLYKKTQCIYYVQFVKSSEIWQTVGLHLARYIWERDLQNESKLYWPKISMHSIYSSYCRQARWTMDRATRKRTRSDCVHEKAWRGATFARNASAAQHRPRTTGGRAACFSKMLLVFGCIGTDFRKKICVWQHFSKSTRLSSCNFWNMAKFGKICDICKKLLNFHKKCWFFKPIFC